MLNAAEDMFAAPPFMNNNSSFYDGQYTGGSPDGYHNGYRTSGNVRAGTAGSLIHYGSAVVFTPEPGTFAMLVAGFGMLAFGQRLRCRS